MTNYTLTEADRKLLTELIGEQLPDDILKCRQKLFQALEKKGAYLKFFVFAIVNSPKDEVPYDNCFDNRFLFWLLVDKPERACKLAAEFWRERKK
jgi:hypothetical protein